MTTNPPKQPQADQAKAPSAEKSFKWLIKLLAIVAGCLLILYFSIFHGGVGDKGDFGAFGDYFGGVLNPILGFATVSLLVWSLKYQTDELALTRQVLEETQKEAELSRQAMEAQVNHLQNEAKLNELIRLMAAVKIKCDDMLNSNVAERELSFGPLHFSQPRSYGRYNPSITKRTYRDVICIYIPSKFGELYDDLIPLLQRQYNELNSSWKELEELLCLYTRLALRYYDINKSTEFAVVYMKEAGEMLAPFHNIFQTDETTTLLQKVIRANSISMSSMLYEDLDD